MKVFGFSRRTRFIKFFDMKLNKEEKVEREMRFVTVMLLEVRRAGELSESVYKNGLLVEDTGGSLVWDVF